MPSTLFLILMLALRSVPTTDERPVALTPKEALASARALVASHPTNAALVSIGKSYGGASIDVLVISENVLNSDKKPSVLLVGGLDGNRPSSVAVTVQAAAQLLTRAELLKSTTFYVIPCANPDAYAAIGARCSDIAGRNLRPIDEDRDGRIDEDRPQDINADGAITMMRRVNPPADDPPTHLPDPADTRLMRGADATKDLRASHTLYIEGLDGDQDGLIAEDGTGGVDIDRNFPHRWQEFDRTAGATQLSEPESQALAQFVLDHPRIIAALVIGRWDNLAKTPDSKGRDITGQTPLMLEGADQPAWEEMGKRWRELSSQSRCEECDPSGSLALWLYAHRGIPTFATQLWGRPDASPAPAPPTTAPPSPVLTPADTESAGWLQWSDRDQAGHGFVAWTPFDHPTLGKVEIGGFRAGFRSDPPAGEVPRLSTAVTNFLSELATKQPRVAVRNVTTSPIAPGVFELQAEIVNEGWLPTSCGMGRINKQPAPIIVRLSTPKNRLLSGQRVTTIEALAGAGDRRSFRWIIRALPAEITALEVVWKPMGTQRIEITNETATTAITVTP
ncbi:MAG: hypothetical protein EXS17_01150 [Phycisphaerales bacterium]|nr:hypothetical protein [Phycisphaerales bacterium]